MGTINQRSCGQDLKTMDSESDRVLNAKVLDAGVI